MKTPGSSVEEGSLGPLLQPENFGLRNIPHTHTHTTSGGVRMTLLMSKPPQDYPWLGERLADQRKPKIWVITDQKGAYVRRLGTLE